MGILYALLSYAIDATINFVDKFLLAKYDVHPIVITIYSSFFALLISIVLLIFMGGLYPIDSRSFIIILASGILTGFILLAYFKALSLDDTSRVVPLFNFGPVFALLLSLIFLKENLSFKQYAGSAIVIAAGFLLSMEKVELGFLKIRKALWYMLIASFLSAGGLVLFKLGVRDIGFWAGLPYEGFGIALAGVLILLYPSHLAIVKKEFQAKPKRILGLMSIEEIIYISSRYIRYFAATLIPAGIVSVLVGSQSFFALIYGVLLSRFFPGLLKEQISKQILLIKVSSILLMSVGLYLIFL